jgi:hypothetical protein
MMLYEISRGMKLVGKLANDMRLDKALVEMLVNDFVSQRQLIIAEKKCFFGSKKERNND